MSNKVETCIHASTAPVLRAVVATDARCGLAALSRKTHGFLCANHYRLQQQSIPPKPRMPQPLWKGNLVQRDEIVIADIIATDKTMIAAGRIVEVRRGRNEPIVLRFLEAPSVH